MPIAFSYDEYTSGLYAKEHGGVEPGGPDDAEFTKWRAAKITEYAKRFAAAVHAVNPKCIVSVSPAPYPWCYENYCCDWPSWTGWTGASRWDEYIPQNYRFTYRRTKASIEEGLKVIGNRRSDLLAGIRVVGDGPDLKATDLIRTIEYTRQAKLGGHVLWFSRGVLDVHPKELKAFYNVTQFGQAPHPARPADWRPLPIVAQRLPDGSWQAKVEKPARYQVIAKKGGSWAFVETSELGVGLKTWSNAKLTDAESVELLIERRP
jgi:hypothetical protein